MSAVFYLDGNLYNIVHGTNRYAYFLLGALGIPPEHTGRFRDCYMSSAIDSEFEIHIYTRNGGGNRPGYQAVTERLRAHPQYLRDFDSTDDPTYASYVFSVPAEIRDKLEECVRSDAANALPKSHEERSLAFEKLATMQPNHPEVVRVQAILKPTVDLISAAMDSGQQAVAMLDRD